MSDIRWEGYSHEEIYARVQQGPGRLASADAEAAWTTVENTIRDVDAQLTRAVNRIGAGWQGRAAEAVHGGMTVMSNWALDAAGDATLTRNGIVGQAEQAARLRTAMPPPRTAEWHHMVTEQVPALGLMAATGDLGALEDRMANDRAAAVDLMNRYSSQSSDNQRMMNYWTQPPTVVVETVSSSPSAGGAGVGIAAVGSAGALASAGLGAARTAVPARGGPRGIDVAGPTTSGGGAAGTTPGGPPPGATAPDGLPAGTTPGPVGALPGIVPAGPGPGPGAAATRSVPTIPPGAGPPPGPAVPPGAGSAYPPGTGPGVVGRPAVPGTSRGSLPPEARPGTGGVRAVVPGPPAQPGTTDWRTGQRSLPTDPARPGVLGTAVDAERAAASRGWGGHGFVPMSGAARPVDQEHRRPAYLIDDTDAFADDRWFPPPVIGGDIPASRV